MTQLYGETIKNAIFGKLKELFPSVAVYKEQITLPEFPNFFINQLNVSTVEDRKDRYFITYLMNIRYRQVGDISTEPKLEQRLDDVGINLIINFTDIEIGGKPRKIIESYYEKVDGVLHFSCKVKLQVEKEQIEQIKMENVEIITNLKGE